jgi:hypothetical protein
MSYVILRGRCHIIILNVLAPEEDKSDNMKDSFYEELERVFDKFPKCLIKNFVGRFQCQSRQEKPFTTETWKIKLTRNQ